jgi:hypothetical protein
MLPSNLPVVSIYWTSLIVGSGIAAAASIYSFTASSTEDYGMEWLFGDPEKNTKSLSEMIVYSDEEVRAKGTFWMLVAMMIILANYCLNVVPTIRPPNRYLLPLLNFSFTFACLSAQGVIAITYRAHLP